MIKKHYAIIQLYCHAVHNNFHLFVFPPLKTLHLLFSRDQFMAAKYKKNIYTKTLVMLFFYYPRRASITRYTYKRERRTRERVPKIYTARTSLTAVKILFRVASFICVCITYKYISLFFLIRFCGDIREFIAK